MKNFILPNIKRLQYYYYFFNIIALLLKCLLPTTLMFSTSCLKRMEGNYYSQRIFQRDWCIQRNRTLALTLHPSLFSRHSCFFQIQSHGTRVPS